MGSVISDSVCMALYLFNHPGMIVEKKGKYFMYDSGLGYFICCNPNNKVRRNWRRAYGLDAYFNSYKDSIYE